MAMSDDDFLVKIETRIARSGYGVVILLTNNGVIEDKWMGGVASRKLLSMIISDVAASAIGKAKERAEEA